MDLQTGASVWGTRGWKIYSYETLKKNISCDVLIVGGGITGALLAYQLSKDNDKGLSIVVVEKDKVAGGSTSASTALLVYGLDVDLPELSQMIGEETAVKIYKISRSSVVEIKKIIEGLEADVDYKEKKTLYLASKTKDTAKLRAEYEMLRKNGFEVEFLEKDELQNKFGIDRDGAIIYQEGAEVDPVKLTYALLNKAQQNGVKIYEHTDIAEREANDRNTCEKEILTTEGYKIKTCDLVFATGYESQKYLGQNLVDLKSSYVVASSAGVLPSTHWLGDYLVWETARPYMYIRTSEDGRILVGGEDAEVVDASARDAFIPEKTKTLERKYEALVKDLPISIQYAWTGTFGETKDGLGYVGIPKDYNNIYFALGFGGNGIPFGVIAANIIKDLLYGKVPQNYELFSFNRKI